VKTEFLDDSRGEQAWGEPIPQVREASIRERERERKRKRERERESERERERY
jgi:hypothetical protein